MHALKRLHTVGFVIRAIIALCIVVILLQGSLRGAVAAPLAEIRGIIIDSSSQRAIAGINIRLVSPNKTYNATTDKGGFFDVIVEPDTYTISFDKIGYTTFVVQGITLTSGQVRRFDETLERGVIKVIGGTKSRSRNAGSPFQPTQSVQTYTLTETQIDRAQGKAFNQDESTLLRSVPSVTLDKSGTISIRGGFAFEAAYEYEGIDYTVPNSNLQNTQQNIGNFNLINGLSSVSVIPGGGDATHGNTGTGLISFTAKRGTYPYEVGFDVESNLFPYGHQLGFDFGIADKHNTISDYFSFIGQRQGYQYGPDGEPADELGTRGTNASTLNSTVDPNLVYYSPSFLSSNDFINNLILRFGKAQNQSLQFFFQGQAIKQDLDYGGASNLQYFTGGSGSGFCPSTGSRTQPSNNTLTQTILCNYYLPLYPGQQTAGSFLSSGDEVYSPFNAFKFEYTNILATKRDSTAILLQSRYFRTFSQQSQELPSVSIFAPAFGGIRSAFESELTDPLGSHHSVEVGLKFGYSQPFGTIVDGSRYGAFTYGPEITEEGSAANFNFNPVAFASGLGTAPAGAPAIDFLTPSQCAQLGFTNVPAFRTANPGAPVPSGVSKCGYLNSYFPAGAPRFPAEVDQPDASVQDYSVFAQDTLSLLPHDRLHITAGLRLDGYNFQQPIDPSSPPGILGQEHNRQYEPHLGFAWQFTDNDAIRANFGHTLTVPLPSLLGTQVERSSYNAFNNVPSFDNSTGAAARYCGVFGNQLCQSYADQLYWLTRNYRFGAQPLNQALQGATFTNIDFSYEHQFKDNIALKVTPFYRRGYNIAEQAASIVGNSATTGAPIYGNVISTTDGQQKATGLEFEATRDVPFGLSETFGVTFINQFGNEPPGAFLTPASLALGTLYHSPDLSPLQMTLALTYKTHSGIRINPVFYFNNGYPYGIGYYGPAFCGPNGSATIVPITGNTPGSTQNGAPNFVDPVNPGTCLNPNIAATRGNQEAASAGGLRSPQQLNTNVTFEWSPRNSSSTFGLQIRNLFNQLYNVPVANYCYGVPVSTGVIYRTGTTPCYFGTVANAGPGPNASPNSPYNIYPNLAPFTARVYYQLKL